MGVCIKDNSALLIDAGHFPKKSAGLKGILEKKLGCRIEVLFNTHYHSDHTFGNQSFDCPIISSEECKNIMQKNLSTHWRPEEIRKAMEEDPELKQEWKDLKITLPTKTFQDKLSYNFEGISVIFQKLGGHTKGSSIAHFLDYKVLFSGDILFGDCYPTQLSIDPSPFELVKTLRKISQMNVETIVPGHGTTCDKLMVRKLTEYWQCLLSECQKLVGNGLSDGEIKETLSTRCHLETIAFDKRKQKRNVDSVLKYVREKFT